MFVRYPPFGKEKTDYAYAVGRIRALETRLLDRQRVERLLEAKDAEEVLRSLQDTDYGAYIPQMEGPLAFEGMLEAERARAFELFEELALEEELVYWVRSFYDFHNVKVLIKSLIAEKDFRYALSPHGNIPPEDIKAIFQEERYDKLPAHLQTAVEKGISSYYEKRDPQRISLAVDQSAYLYLTGRSVRDAFLRNYFRLQADLLNLMTIVRLKFIGREDLIRFSLLPGGFLEIERYTQEPLDTLSGRLYHTPYYAIFDEGINSLRAKGSFSRLYKLMDDYLVGYLKETRTVALGPEPLIAYLYGKMNEIKILRMIFVGKIYHMSKEEIRERLPLPY